MTTIGWVVCPICFLGVGFSGVSNSILLMDAREELNRLLPKKEQGEILFASLDYYQFRRKYRRLRPNSELLRQSEKSTTLMFLFFVLAILTAFLFGNDQRTSLEAGRCEVPKAMLWF
jgi:hypothetical protein